MEEIETLRAMMEVEEMLLMPIIVVLGYLARKNILLSERVAWLEGRGGHDLGEAVESKGGE